MLTTKISYYILIIIKSMSSIFELCALIFSETNLIFKNSTYEKKCVSTFLFPFEFVSWIAGAFVSRFAEETSYLGIGETSVA